MAKAKNNADWKYSCFIPQLTPAQALVAAQIAVEINPANRPQTERLVKGKSATLTPARLAMLTSAWWGSDGANLTVGFMEPTSNELTRMILEAANLWGSRGANISFTLSRTDPDIRISRGKGGYYSYLGNQSKGIPRNQQTMNLQDFTARTAWSEFLRVVCHEFGHAIGCPHEHQRKSIVDLLDVAKTIAKFGREQGWSPREVRQQVLEYLEEHTIMGTLVADVASIMAYMFPGSITKNGKPIPGGSQINDSDYLFIAKMYPPKIAPPPPPPPPGADGEGELRMRDGKKYKLVATAA